MPTLKGNNKIKYEGEWITKADMRMLGFMSIKVNVCLVSRLELSIHVLIITQKLIKMLQLGFLTSNKQHENSPIIAAE